MNTTQETALPPFEYVSDLNAPTIAQLKQQLEIAYSELSDRDNALKSLKSAAMTHALAAETCFSDILSEGSIKQDNARKYRKARAGLQKLIQ